ncbi:PLP-dependent aminotransferase family protein [Propionicicella superfundia]|uniref:aminotransferase-like domain-containing protein n=1 Tax=Propionicicella superfundia TaxID=348582 RepID=UPI00040B4CF4|nr:PLP-dependent aminotransferase family protein [Propionicicella superfundia]
MHLPDPLHRDTVLDTYVDHYAERTHGMSVSAVRALFSVANRPEVVSLAGGMPNIADLPRIELGAAVDRLIRENGTQAMQYGSGQGELVMRERICDVMALEGIRANPDDVVVTCGSSQGLDLVTRLFCDPGDVVLAEAPTYVGAIGTFNSYQAEIHHVAMDDDGLRPDDLRTAIRTLRAAGKKVKFLYTVPNFQNPSGITQSLERRRDLLAVAREEDLLIVEDNPYGLLQLDADEPTPAIRSLDGDNVIYLGSFSKTFAPGFRVGWVLAPHAVRERLLIAQEAATLCPPVFSQFVISQYMTDFDWKGQIVAFRDMYRARRDAMLTGLAEHMPAGTSWTHPRGGFFVWVTLPEGIDAYALLPRAVTAKVAYVPGTAFFTDGLGSRNMRLSFCFPTAERILEGTRRLGEVLHNELEIHKTFGLGVDVPRHIDATGAPAPNIS